MIQALSRTGTVAKGTDGGTRPVAGLLIRLGPGPTLLGTPDTGMDDSTFERFVRETFSRRDRSRHSRIGKRRS